MGTTLRSETGIEEAHRAGRSIGAAGLAFDLAFTSVLSRALTTTTIILEEVYGQRTDDLPEVRKSWQLSERHYGALTGKNKAQMVQEYGKDQVVGRQSPMKRSLILLRCQPSRSRSGEGPTT